jgi:prepilin-type N-terminal cleavage/methylation domain-containing protein
MNINRPLQPRRQRGFTLIEMIGVLAIIAVLAGMLVPRVFSAINDSRINSAVMSINGVKSAAMLYFGKYGKFGGVAGATVTDFSTNNVLAGTWDAKVLVAEGFLDKPFEAKVGTAATIELKACETTATTVTTGNDAYDFDSVATSNEAGGGLVVVQCRMTGLAPDDAFAINKALDGVAFAGASGVDDLLGRVKYDATTGDVLIYIAHK